VDRFGKLPHQAQTLLDVHRLRVLAKDYGVVKVDAAPSVINISFKPNPPVDPMSIIQLIQKKTATSNSPATTNCASNATYLKPKTAP
jgi:transcription-repair coupling factor (superfamily II helicase)